MATFEAERIEGREQPIPAEWRDLLKSVADAFVAGRLPDGGNIRSVDVENAEISFENIRSYPDAIGSLNDVSWTTSICAWMGSYWEVLVDLTTLDGNRSDLVLDAKVFEVGGRIEVEPYLVYVP